MSGIESLVTLFQEFPGIGPRQARRFVYFLLRADSGYREKLIAELRDLAGGVARCSLCARFIAKHDHGSHELCPICKSTSRDAALLTLVLKDADIEAIEQSAAYNGLYFVLGSLIKLTDTEAPERTISRIRARIHTAPKPSEIIIALPVTTDGEHTRTLIEDSLMPLCIDESIRLSTLGRGLSTGSELEYADPATLKSAFSKRA